MFRSGNNEIEILYQITLGLQYLHTLGIVHRDIKPSNILIFVPSAEDNDGADAKYIEPRMKLADFGLCKILNQQMSNKEEVESDSHMMKLIDVNKKDFTNTSLTNPRGSRGWMPPEVYFLDRFDFAVDIWALGCIFAYTLTWGEHPFGDDIDERSDRIIKKEPMLLLQEDLNKNPFMSSITKSKAYELIKSMLDVDPTIRPSVDEVLGHPFFSMASSVIFIIY